jgi:RNA 2',3'-cyclic 3'-phosphodiesterase
LIRLFAALAIPDGVAQSLAPSQCGIAGARWRPAQTLHVTLRFFGDVTETLAEDLDSELAKVTGQALSLSLSGVGAFDEGERVTAIWAGLKENEALRVLARRCEAAARRAGLKPEGRNYTPHVTLAYLGHSDPAQVTAWLTDHSGLTSEPFTLNHFGLYSSWQTSEGSRYTSERIYRL